MPPKARIERLSCRNHQLLITRCTHLKSVSDTNKELKDLISSDQRAYAETLAVDVNSAPANQVWNKLRPLRGRTAKKSAEKPLPILLGADNEPVAGRTAMDKR